MDLPSPGPEGQAPPRRLQSFLLLALACFVMAGLSGTESFLRTKPPFTLEKWRLTVFNTGFYWTPWIVLLPLVYRMARRWRLDRQLTLPKLQAHAVGMALILAAHLLLMTLLPLFYQWVVFEIPAKWLWKAWIEYPLHYRLSWVASGLYLYPVFLVLASAVEYRRELRTRELEAAQLEARLAQAEWQALRNQLHPRFLFQALKGISTLMRRDMEAAERLLDLLADLLRRSLREGALQELPLRQEVAFVAQYLDIERLRLDGHPQVEIRIDGACEEARVPHRLLQPLVENAVRHGLEPRGGRGTVRLEARRDGDTLHLAVSSDASPPPGWQEGAGLAALRSQLERLRPEPGALSLETAEGFTVHLRLPFLAPEAL